MSVSVCFVLYLASLRCDVSFTNRTLADDAVVFEQTTTFHRQINVKPTRSDKDNQSNIADGVVERENITRNLVVLMGV